MLLGHAWRCYSVCVGVRAYCAVAICGAVGDGVGASLCAVCRFSVRVLVTDRGLRLCQCLRLAWVHLCVGFVYACVAGRRQ